MVGGGIINIARGEEEQAQEESEGESKEKTSESPTAGGHRHGEVQARVRPYMETGG